MERDVTGGIFILVLIVGLFSLAYFWPSNPLTGHAVEDVCDTCLELCSVGENTCSKPSETCCPTYWDSGVCAYPSDCDDILAFSERDTQESYEEVLAEQPAPIQSWSHFFFPIVIVFMILVYFVFRRNNPHW